MYQALVVGKTYSVVRVQSAVFPSGFLVLNKWSIGQGFFQWRQCSSAITRLLLLCCSPGIPFGDSSRLSWSSWHSQQGCWLPNQLPQCKYTWSEEMQDCSCSPATACRNKLWWKSQQQQLRVSGSLDSAPSPLKRTPALPARQLTCYRHAFRWGFPAHPSLILWST